VIELVAAGWGEGWWRAGGSWWVSDGVRLWSPGRRTRWWDAPGVRQVVADPFDGPRAVTGAGNLRLHAGGAASPLRRSTPLRAAGGLEAWVADGFAYVRRDGRTRALDALGPGEWGWVAGGGALVVEGPSGVRAGAPGRTPAPLGEGEGIRVAEDGSALALLGPDGPWRLGLADGSRRALPGLPVTDTLAWVDGLVRGRGLRSPPVVREGSAALREPLLAGPGGRVWDLRAARPVTAPGSVLAGVTVPLGEGFLTLDGETGEGWLVDAAGPGRPVRLPLEPDDAVRGALAADGAALVVSSLGAGFRVTPDGAVRPAAPPPLPRTRPRALDSPAGPLRATGSLALAGRTWAWNDDGWLWRF
jgi:hypothetical protein